MKQALYWELRLSIASASSTIDFDRVIAEAIVNHDSIPPKFR